MFSARYFPPSYFPGRYFPPLGEPGAEPPPDPEDPPDPPDPGPAPDLGEFVRNRGNNLERIRDLLTALAIAYQEANEL